MSAPAVASACAKKVTACCCTKRYSVVCSGRWRSRWKGHLPAPAAAAGRWLAREAPEVLTSDGLKSRAASQSLRRLRTGVCPPLRGLRRGRKRGAAGAAHIRQGSVVALDADIALSAAHLGLSHMLPLAGPVMLATARLHGAAPWAKRRLTVRCVGKASKRVKSRATPSHFTASARGNSPGTRTRRRSPPRPDPARTSPPGLPRAGCCTWCGAGCDTHSPCPRVRD